MGKRKTKYYKLKKGWQYFNKRFFINDARATRCYDASNTIRKQQAEAATNAKHQTHIDDDDFTWEEDNQMCDEALDKIPPEAQIEVEEKTNAKQKPNRDKEGPPQPESEEDSESELSSDDDINNEILRKEANWHDKDIISKLASIENKINILNKEVAKNKKQYDIFGQEVSYLLNTLPVKHAAELKSKLDQVITDFKTDLVSRGIKLKRKKFEPKPPEPTPVPITEKRKSTAAEQKTAAKKKKVCRHAELVKQIEKMKATIYPKQPTTVQQKTINCQPTTTTKSIQQQPTHQVQQKTTISNPDQHKPTHSHHFQSPAGHSHKVKQKTTKTNPDQQVTTISTLDQQGASQRQTTSHKHRHLNPTDVPKTQAEETSNQHSTRYNEDLATISTNQEMNHQTIDEEEETEQATRSVEELLRKNFPNEQ